MERNLNKFENEELIRGAFEVIDQHGDGYITYQQLHQVSTGLKSREVSPERLVPLREGTA